MVKKLKSGRAVRNRIATLYRIGAKRRSIKFDLSDDQLDTLFSGNCFYCGVEPSNYAKEHWLNGSFTYSGIDRVNNDEGYTIENCVPCCKDCNFAKGKKPIDEFLDYIQRISEYQKNGT